LEKRKRRQTKKNLASKEALKQQRQRAKDMPILQPLGAGIMQLSDVRETALQLDDTSKKRPTSSSVDLHESGANKKPRLVDSTNLGQSGNDIALESPANFRPSPPLPTINKPTPPPTLEHLVMGINEVVKTLERQISDLRIRIMIMGDALGQTTKKHTLNGRIAKSGKPELLPTAPVDADLNEPGLTADALAVSRPEVAENTAMSPLEWIIIPLGDISPQTLVSYIPQYCASYNTLVYQHTHLSKIAKARLPPSSVDTTTGSPREEVRVVPLGRVEGELAQLVGLRRLACLGIRVSPLTAIQYSDYIGQC